MRACVRACVCGERTIEMMCHIAWVGCEGNRARYAFQCLTITLCVPGVLGLAVSKEQQREWRPAAERPGISRLAMPPTGGAPATMKVAGHLVPVQMWGQSRCRCAVSPDAEFWPFLGFETRDAIWRVLTKYLGQVGGPPCWCDACFMRADQFGPVASCGGERPNVHEHPRPHAPNARLQ